MKKSLISAAVGITLFATTAHAQPYGNYGPAYGHPSDPRGFVQEQRPVQADTPDQILRQGIDRLKGFMAWGGSASEDDVKTFLNREIAPYFDFRYMAQWAGGYRYRTLSAEQQVDFANQLQDLFFAALSRNLGTYSNPTPRIDIYPARVRSGSREVTVEARVTPDKGYPVRLHFRFYRGDQGWKVFDVTANGTSAVAYYRRYFNQRGGAR